MIRQLAHICIRTQDLEGTAAFYRDVLGLEQRFEFVRNDEQVGIYFHIGNHTFIEIFRGDPGGAGNIRHLCLEVEDIDALIVQLNQHGYETTPKKQGNDRSWQTWTTDPNGVNIEFQQYTAESRQLIGGTCVMKR